MMDINLVSKKLVKPCTPTPQNPKTYKLSFLDELYKKRDMEIGVLLFYTLPKEKQIIINLELSLSKVLVQFYPIRCILVKDCHIECCDQGVEFVEAEALTLELADLIGKRDFKNHQTGELIHPLLSIQITHLRCGGITLRINVHDVIFDASSLGTFIVAWTILPRVIHVGILVPSPHILIFPKSWEDNPYKSREPRFVSLDTSTSIKRFTFNKQAIERVRSNLRPKQREKGWLKVLVESYVIAKAVMGVERRKRGGPARSFFVNHVVNLRERTGPPLPKHACGNFSFMGRIKCMNDMGIQELVDVMRQGINETLATCAKMLPLDKDG